MIHERIEFENWLGIKPCGAAHDIAWAAWKARASLPTQPAAQATPDQFADASKLVAPVALRSVHLTRDTVGMCIVRINGRVAIRDNGDIIDHTATLEWFADTQQATPSRYGSPELQALIVQHATQQATPEPVGDVRCEGCGYMTHHREHMGCVRAAKQHTRPAPGVPEEALAVAEHIRAKAATPEPVGEVVATVRTIRGVTIGYLETRLPDGTPLYTHTAPGVPEDVQRDAERLDWLTFNISGKALRDIGVMWGEHANARAAIDAAMLAAAQAKGADK